MTGIPEPARTVFYRGDPDYQFDVDGEPFPWFISTAGAQFTRLTDDWYAVRVELFSGMIRPSTPPHSPEHVTDEPALVLGDKPFLNPIISGRRFPWAITGDGYEASHSRTSFLTLKLEFFAHEVDTNTIIEDVRGPATFGLDGSFWGGAEPDLPESV